MPKITYVPKRFNQSATDLIFKINSILENFSRQGFEVTLRTVYYQIVGRDLFPDDRRWRWTGSKWVRDPNGTKNAEPNYKWLGQIVNDARLAGLIDWEAIIDRTRNLQTVSHWRNPGEIIEATAHHFRMDKWKMQSYRPEVWIEKDALIGVISGVCEELDVPYFSCRGYTSQSEMWVAGQRLNKYKKNGYVPIIFHLGDHDPSGVDMTRDIEGRLQMFMGGTTMMRLALNMSQIREYDLPPNPAKLTDSRCNRYIAEFGEESWELDALEPQVIADLVRDAVNGILDEDAWEEASEEEDRHRGMLREAADRWSEVEDLLSKE